MTDATRVRGGFYLLRIAVCTSDPGDQVNILALGKVGKLVETDQVVFCALILVNVYLGGTVAEIYA